MRSTLHRVTRCKNTRLTGLCRAIILTALYSCITVQGVWAEDINFQKQIRTLLSDKCFKCHGPSATGRKADLRLDLQESSRRETDSGLKAIEPGKPDKSEIMVRILSKDPDGVMPPPDSFLSLTQEEISLLEKWIEQGAEYANHWAFESIQKPNVPKVSDDLVPFVKNPVDAFLLSSLENQNLRFEELAPRSKQLRRLSFDLLGLPPGLPELEKFDKNQEDDFYEAKVEEYLSNEAFGERLASEWLDVARYSDTYGYQVDRDRYVWPWRDWVIRAFNQNLSYKDFITWQIAGDLLPNPTKDQILATTFNRLHPQKVEGGSVPEEFRIEYVSDRTHTVGTAFLGLTVECSRCHDHKYDPLTQQEYYQLSSFFDNIDEAGLYSYFTSSIPTPTLLLKDQNMESKIKGFDSEIKSLVKELTETIEEKSARDAFKNWLSQESIQIELPKPIAHFDFEKIEKGKIPNHANKEKPASSGGANKLVPSKNGSGIQLTGDDAVNLPAGNFHRAQAFSIALDIHIPEIFERSVILHRSRAWTDAASRGYELLLVEGKARFSLIHFWPGNAISIETKNVIPDNEWVHITLTYDGSGSAEGLHIYLDNKPADTSILYNNLYKNITGGGGDNIALGQRFRDVGFKKGIIDNLAVFDSELTELEVSLLNSGLNISDKHTVSPAEYTPKQLEAYYFARLHDPARTISQSIQSKLKSRNDLYNGIQEIMVMKESKTPRQTWFLDRGSYELRKFPVDSRVPAFIPPALEVKDPTRLDLAEWLTDIKNPLTSRVTVNRYWQMIFGRGLVRTTEDFGLQGNSPTHPELLDWLSYEFMERNWDIRWLVKTMVTSHAYRQNSSSNREKIEKDPENLMFSRAANYRLPAEMIRDNALATAGLLVNKVGGKPVKPYEVEQSFKKANRDKGESLYRRSLYTWWKRTGPAPTMLALDASKRDVCTVKRERTTTPIQAFIFLNDPQFVEAARMIADNYYQKNQGNIPDSINDIFKALTSRQPTSREIEILSNIYQTQLSLFKESPENIKTYLNVGDTRLDEKKYNNMEDIAALAVLTNALLAHDECVMKK